MPDVRVQTGSAVASTLLRPASPPAGSSPTPPVPATGFVALLPPSFGQILGDMMTTIPVARAASASTGRDAMKPTGTPETALTAPADNTLAVSESAKPIVALRPKEGASRVPDGDRSATPSRAENEPASTGIRPPDEPSHEAIDEHAGEEELTNAALLVAVAPPPTPIPVIVAPEAEVTASLLPTTPTVLPDDGASSSATESPKASIDLAAGLAPEEATAMEETLDPVNAKPIVRPNRPEGLPSDLLEAAKPPSKEAPPIVTPPKPEAAGTATAAVGMQPMPEAPPPVDSMPRQVTRIIESAVVATKVAAQAAADVPLSDNSSSRIRESGSTSTTVIDSMAASTRAIAGASAGGASGELSGGLSGNLAGSESGGTRAITSVAGRGDAPTFAERMTSLTEARANQAEMIDRIVQHTKMGVENGQTRIRLQLQPPALGHLRLDLGVRDGVLSARLETETKAAQVVLQMHLDTLRDSLEKQGIIVGSFDVSVRQQGQSGAAFAFGRPNYSDNASRAASRRSSPEPEPALAEIGAGTSSRGWHLVDLFA